MRAQVHTCFDSAYVLFGGNLAGITLKIIAIFLGNIRKQVRRIRSPQKETQQHSHTHNRI